jgi:lipopolysaccharide/colanic/teichoic acid biosynthesis glycosyltransferase
MYKDSESKGKLTIGSDVRITKPGKFLRKYKIDELPQLIDVLLGKMSLVGPRPEVQEFIELYPIDIRSKVLSVRPGITDMASIEMIDENEILGKYKDVKQAYIDIILPIKQQHYVNYVDNRNILLDVKIIYLTFRKIFSR